jgi:hypothetical protein
MALVRTAITTGHPTTTGVIDDLAHVQYPDGTSGPWHPGLDPAAISYERLVLGNACYVLVVGLSMMRDSEIHEIAHGSLVEHYGTPAIVSTRHKHDPNQPAKHWWITEPVAEAIAVAEQLSSDPDRIFTPSYGPTHDGDAHRPVRRLRDRPGHPTQTRRDQSPGQHHHPGLRRRRHPLGRPPRIGDRGPPASAASKTSTRPTRPATGSATAPPPNG